MKGKNLCLFCYTLPFFCSNALCVPGMLAREVERDFIHTHGKEQDPKTRPTSKLVLGAKPFISVLGTTQDFA